MNWMSLRYFVYGVKIVHAVTDNSRLTEQECGSGNVGGGGGGGDGV